MKRSLLRFGVALVVVIGVVTIYAVRSGAQDLQLNRQAVVRSISNCATATADGTVTMGAGATAVQQVSGNSYGTATCNRYLLDINVPSTATPPPGYQSSITLWGKDNSLATVSPDQCNGLRTEVTVYKKVAGVFTQIYTARSHGGWNSEACNPAWYEQQGCFDTNVCRLTVDNETGSASNLSLPASGTDTYRVAVRSYTTITNAGNLVTTTRKVWAGASRYLIVP